MRMRLTLKRGWDTVCEMEGKLDAKFMIGKDKIIKSLPDGQMETVEESRLHKVQQWMFEVEKSINSNGNLRAHLELVGQGKD